MEKAIEDRQNDCIRTTQKGGDGSAGRSRGAGLTNQEGSPATILSERKKRAAEGERQAGRPRGKKVNDYTGRNAQWGKGVRQPGPRQPGSARVEAEISNEPGKKKKGLVRQPKRARKSSRQRRGSTPSLLLSQGERIRDTAPAPAKKPSEKGGH